MVKRELTTRCVKTESPGMRRALSSTDEQKRRATHGGKAHEPFSRERFMMPTLLGVPPSRLPSCSLQPSFPCKPASPAGPARRGDTPS